MEYRSSNCMEVAAAIGFPAAFVSIAAFAMAEGLLRRARSRERLLISLTCAGLPLLQNRLLSLNGTQPNVHGLAAVGHFGYFLASDGCAVLMLVSAVYRLFRR